MSVRQIMFTNVVTVDIGDKLGSGVIFKIDRSQ